MPLKHGQVDSHVPIGSFSAGGDPLKRIASDGLVLTKASEHEFHSQSFFDLIKADTDYGTPQA